MRHCTWAALEQVPAGDADPGGSDSDFRHCRVFVRTSAVPPALTTSLPLDPALKALGYSQSPATRACLCGVIAPHVLTQTLPVPGFRIPPLRGYGMVVHFLATCRRDGVLD